eukprot:11871265-Alexandrium_andersonii.AAC.1
MVTSCPRPAELGSINTPTSLLARDAVVQLQGPTMALTSTHIILACERAGPPKQRPTALYSGP